MILKSPAPEVPADFTGGFIKINTKDLPTESSLTVSYATGINTATHFSAFRYNPGSVGDYFGFGSGSRMWQGGIKGYFDNNDKTFVDRATRQGFNNDWSVRKRSAVPDQRFNLAFGRSWTLRDGDRFALTGALNYSYTERAYPTIGDVDGDGADELLCGSGDGQFYCYEILDNDQRFTVDTPPLPGK